MNGFLVLGRAIFDDVPVRLLPSKEVAHAFASLLTEDDVLSVASQLDTFEASQVECIAIVEFWEGSPVGTEIVKEFYP